MSTTICVSGDSARIAGIASRLEAARHVEVEHEHRGVVAADVAPRGVDVARLGDDLEVLLGVEQHAQAAADHGVVVGQDDADRTILGRRLRPSVVRHTHKRSSVGVRGACVVARSVLRPGGRAEEGSSLAARCFPPGTGADAPDGG